MTWDELNKKYPEAPSSEDKAAYRKYLDDFFEAYETAGFSDTFWTPYEDKTNVGKKFSVVRRCEEPEWDLEALPAWTIRFEDGTEIDAYPEEIYLNDMIANGYLVRKEEKNMEKESFISKIKAGDTFYVGDVSLTAADDAHQNFDEPDEPWVVYDENGNGWFEEDVSKEPSRKRLWKVPCVWQVMGYAEIRASSAEEAKEIAKSTIDDLPLPDNGEYLEGSFEIDEEGDPFEIFCDRTLSGR